MGSSFYSLNTSTLRARARASAGISDPFVYTSSVKSGKAPALHADMNPNGVKFRESRDSDSHPTSTAIAFFMDVTGSMGAVPRALQRSMHTCYQLLMRKGYVEHPQLLIGGIGDNRAGDMAPLQLGQFESGNEIDEFLEEKLYIEGGGGGNRSEAYGLALYAAARHTDIDCWNKRRHKGYLFLCGDENPHDEVTASEIEEIFGETIGENSISIESLIEEASKRYEIFFLHVDTSAARAQGSLERWRELLPERVLQLADPSDVASVLSVQVGLVEGRTTLDTARSDLKAAGVDLDTIDRTIGSVTITNHKSLTNLGSSENSLPVPESRKANRL